jgi:hypothetical protein
MIVRANLPGHYIVGSSKVISENQERPGHNDLPRRGEVCDCILCRDLSAATYCVPI